MPTRKRKHKSHNKTRKTRKISHKSYISHKFDSGSIHINSIKNGEKKSYFDLSLQKEIIKEGNKSQYWFYFKVTNVKNKTCKFKLSTHIDCNNGFKNFGVATSYNDNTWFRTKTTSKNTKTTKCGTIGSLRKSKPTKHITWTIKPKHNTIWFAYYVPYPVQRVNKLIKHLARKPFIKHSIIGRSYEKRAIHMLTIGDGCKNIWIIGRQHPGESIGSWIVEGFLKQFFSPIPNLKIRIILCSNPDGVYLGNWYSNKNGDNINLDWKHNKTKETKIINTLLNKQYNDLILDVHGDEESKNHFITHCPTKNIKLYRKMNRLFNIKNKHFQYSDPYKKLNYSPDGKTLDSLDNALTLEGCMKHSIFKYKTLQDESLNVGKTIYDVLYML